MNEDTHAQPYRGVVCLHCSKPFRVPARRREAAPSADEPESAGRSVFLAWCPHCHHEAPYEASAVRDFSAAPPLADAAGRCLSQAAGATS